MKLKNIKTGFILIGMIFFLISCGNDNGNDSGDSGNDSRDNSVSKGFEAFGKLERVIMLKNKADLVLSHFDEFTKTKTKTSCLEKLNQVKKTYSDYQSDAQKVISMLSADPKSNETLGIVKETMASLDKKALHLNRDDACIETGYNAINK